MNAVLAAALVACYVQVPYPPTRPYAIPDTVIPHVPQGSRRLLACSMSPTALRIPMRGTEHGHFAVHGSGGSGGALLALDRLCCRWCSPTPLPVPYPPSGTDTRVATYRPTRLLCHPRCSHTVNDDHLPTHPTTPLILPTSALVLTPYLSHPRHRPCVLTTRRARVPGDRGRGRRRHACRHHPPQQVLPYPLSSAPKPPFLRHPPSACCHHLPLHLLALSLSRPLAGLLSPAAFGALDAWGPGQRVWVGAVRRRLRALQ